MELIQSSFQASFDARVERVNTDELTKLRTVRIFAELELGVGLGGCDCRAFSLAADLPIL